MTFPLMLVQVEWVMVYGIYLKCTDTYVTGVSVDPKDADEEEVVRVSDDEDEDDDDEDDDEDDDDEDDDDDDESL
jgi:hypothetical protein